VAMVRLEYTVDLQVDPEPHPILEYTSPLAKTIILKTAPSLQPAFRPRRRGPPKPLAITPPLDPQTLQPLAPLLHTLTKPDPNDFNPILLRSGPVRIHLTLPSRLTSLAPQTGATATFNYRGAKITASITQTRIIGIAPPPTTRIQEKQTIQIITPYLPKDPYTHSKYSPFTLAPDTTFSIPAYIHIKTTDRRRRLLRTLQTLRKCLILPHTAYCRPRKTWYLKRSRQGQLQPIPSLTGTLVYMTNTYECTQNELLLTQQIIQTAKITGIGKSRANGMGTQHSHHNHANPHGLYYKGRTPSQTNTQNKYKHQQTRNQHRTPQTNNDQTTRTLQLPCTWAIP